MPPAHARRARLRLGAAAAAGVIVAGVTGQLAGLAPGWVTALAVVLAAVGAAVALPADVPVVALPPAPASPAPAPVSAPDMSEHDAQWRSLRHDLRGILSPALLMSDRLLMSTQEPLAKRTAETMIETIERAEKRLSQDPAP